MLQDQMEASLTHPLPVVRAQVGGSLTLACSARAGSAKANLAGPNLLHIRLVRKKRMSQ